MAKVERREYEVFRDSLDLDGMREKFIEMSEMEELPLSERNEYREKSCGICCIQLCTAIIMQACRDYKSIAKKYRLKKLGTKDIRAKEELETFFESEEYSNYSSMIHLDVDGSKLCKKIWDLKGAGPVMKE